MDEMENFRDEIRLWRSADAWQGPRLPPLIIETYLDTSEMTASQALVISDAAGKRWNVTEALNRAANRGGYLGLRTGDKGSSRSQQVVLERWRLEIRYEALSPLLRPSVGQVSRVTVSRATSVPTP